MTGEQEGVCDNVKLDTNREVMKDVGLGGGEHVI